MKKFWQMIWLPIVSGAVIIAIYGGSAVAQSQNQSKTLENRIEELSKKIDQLDSKISKQGELASACSQEPTEESTKVAAAIKPAVASLRVTATPEEQNTETNADQNEQTADPTPTPTPTSIPSSPTPSPSPSPTSTPVPVDTVNVEIQGHPEIEVAIEKGDTAFSVLLKAAQQSYFSVDYKNYEGMGVMVNCIAGVCAHDNYYWAFYYNGQYSLVGASSQPVKDGDVTSWKFETF